MIKTKKAKRIICLALALSLLFLVSCSGSTGKSDSSDKIEILCTIYPQYDWVKNIVGDTDSVTVDILIENGADIHGYQPTVNDMIKLRGGDAVVLVGGESDVWVRQALENAEGTAIILSETEGITLREMSDECVASEHDHESEHSHGHEHGDVYDEHVWLSLNNAATSCRAICDWLCDEDPDNAEIYRANTDKYVFELEALDKKFEALDISDDQQIIFADRFPFVYLFEDYGVSYLAAFEGCSTDSEASFDTVTRLAERLRQTKAKYIAVSESSDQRLAESVMHAAGVECETVVFDSVQSVTEQQAEQGYSYIGAMEKNFDALSKIIK